MSVPAGFADWCAFHGVALVPARWGAATHAAYRAWRLARFRAHVRHFRDTGQWQLIRQQSGQARLLEIVRGELDEALEPIPADVYGRAEGRTPQRRDVGGQTETLGPVLLGVYARIGRAA